MTSVLYPGLSRLRARASAVRAPLCAMAAVLTLIATGIASGAHAQGAADSAAADKVVARVNGVAIHASDVEEAIGQLPSQYSRMPPEKLYKGVLDQLIDRQLVVAQARKIDLQNDPDVKRTMRNLEARVLEQAFYRHTVERKVTDEAVRRRYERDRNKLATGKKVHARHILVKTREEAVKIIKQLHQGADFAKLAREKSIGPSSAQGGDLGFFTRDQMVPAFAAAAFSLRKGEISRAPVKTQYGWHVIKVEDIQKAGPPSFDEVKDKLRSEMTDEAIEAEIKDLHKDAKIERFDNRLPPGGPGGPVPMPAPGGNAP